MLSVMRRVGAPIAALLVAFLAPSLGVAASTKEIMASRYLRAALCTSRILGQEWWKQRGVDLIINRWGFSEPRMRTMESQPERVLKADRECRKANELGDELRPW